MKAAGFLVGLLLVASTVVPGSPSVDDLASEVGEAAIGALAEHGVPGASVAIIDDFQVAWVGAFGEAEAGRTVEIDTLFQAASLSKPVAAVVFAAAAEDGLVDLEADALALTTSWTHPEPWWDGPITIRMLLAHRGGVNVHGFPGYPLASSLPDLATILDGVRDMNEPIRVVAPPGERMYSGGGFLIAQLAMEDSLGIRFEELARRLVLDPLRLEHSTFELLTEPDRDALAVGHRASGEPVAGGGWHLYPETAAASLWTSAGEYAEIVADVMRAHEGFDATVLGRRSAELLLDAGFSVGFGVGGAGHRTTIGHDGANEGFRARFVGVPTLGQGIVILTNSDSGAEVTRAVVDRYAEAVGWNGPETAEIVWWLAAAVVLIAAPAMFWRRRTTQSVDSQRSPDIP